MSTGTSELTTGTGPSAVTRLLKDWGEGDPKAFQALVPLVVEDLREMARKFMAHESPSHTLQPTALVNEVYLRFEGCRSVHWENRDQFFGTAGHWMRRILVDYARKRQADKRGGGARKVTLDDTLSLVEGPPSDILALHAALEKLKANDPRKCRIVELRYFMGLTLKQVAKALKMAPRTVNREWEKARLWLARELDGEPKDPPDG